MNAMEEALKKANINEVVFEAREIDQNVIDADMKIEFLEKWLKMLERNASDKEKHNFVVKHGFISVKQFTLYMACMDDVNNLRDELEYFRHGFPVKEIARREKEIAEKESMAEALKRESYYKIVLRQLGERDVTPYGEDILKRRSF